MNSNSDNEIRWNNLTYIYIQYIQESCSAMFDEKISVADTVHIS